MKSKLPVLLLFIFLVPGVLAFPTGDLSDVLGDIGETMQNLLDSSGFRFGITFILLYMVLYGIFSAGLNKVSIFSGSDGRPNRQGRIIAGSLALMSSMGLAFWAGYNAAEFVERVLSLAGWFGAIAFSFLVFAIGYYNIKQQEEPKWGPILFLMGLAFMTYGVLVGPDAFYGKTMITLGSAFIFFGIVGIILKAFGKTGTEAAKEGGNLAKKLWDPLKNWWGSAPQPVADFQAKMQPRGTVSITWSPSPENDIAHYELKRQKRGRFWSTDKKFGRITGTSATDSNLKSDEEYRYLIRAINQNGNKSKWSVTALQVKRITVTGKAVFMVGEDEYPLEGLDVALRSGETFFGKMKDKFVISDVPTHHEFTLEISDPEGVYNTKKIPNLIFDENQDPFDFGSLDMQPSGKRGTIKVQANNGYFRFPLNFKIYSTKEPEEAKEVENKDGYYNVPLTLGHLVKIKAKDLDECFEGTSEPVLARSGKTAPINLKSKGHFDLTIECFDAVSRENLNDFSVSLKDKFTGSVFNPNNENKFMALPAGYYDFKVTKPGYLDFDFGEYFRSQSGGRSKSHYAHNNHTERKIPLTPNSPTPRDIELEKPRTPLAKVKYE
ncbi:MAG: fibronectin type III domain-containing protein [Candidatus Woesearchaeota archaeon]